MIKRIFDTFILIFHLLTDQFLNRLFIDNNYIKFSQSFINKILAAHLNRISYEL